MEKRYVSLVLLFGMVTTWVSKITDLSAWELVNCSIEADQETIESDLVR